MKNDKFSLKLGEKNLQVEINNLAEQAAGSAFVRYGDTLVLTTCCMSKQDRENLGFFPLTVEYQEKYYAAGKIKGARYIRREGKPSDEAILNSRLIDRSIRPLFPKGLKREVQVISTVLAWDEENDPDILALISASIALSISNIPFAGPIGAVRVSKKDNKLLINAKYEDRNSSSRADVIFVGVEKDKQVLINMIEGEFEESEEKDVLNSLEFSLKDIKRLIDFQKDIQKKLGKEKIEVEEQDIGDFKEKSEKFLKQIEKVFFEKDKQKRSTGLDEIKNNLIDFVKEEYPGDDNKIEQAKELFDREQDRLLHENIIKYDKRPDSRKLDEIRELSCQVGIIPRAHGSGLFSRGPTKALSVLTLGAPGDQQLLEGMEIVGQKRFMHHYNFPPYSAGETGFLRGPGRREIGHGILVEKALRSLLPAVDDFPYTIRIVTEILSSNGSTSQASVSSSCLALQDAGVPIKRPAAGIAIGLVGNKVLTDIQGPEDYHGDMDFKIAGTEKGITAIQMDVKIKGITLDIAKEALQKAKKARLEILAVMKKTIAYSRENLSPYAPRILTLQINPDKIREVIGPGGRVINEIIDQTGAAIDIEDSGLIFVTAEKEEAAKRAISWIKSITREIKIGEVFEGKVKRILEFGAFVEILPGQEGLIHISKLSDKRINRVEDVLRIGDRVLAKVISIDEQGRINLALIKK
ncbi:polynucleotide phosphorylase [Parcubacteria bacterium DG_72]|nr:MAG: polynucleotide phosphorylase [Parcubacteria bacterium DG_72]